MEPGERALNPLQQHKHTKSHQGREGQQQKQQQQQREEKRRENKGGLEEHGTTAGA